MADWAMWRAYAVVMSTTALYTFRLALRIGACGRRQCTHRRLTDQSENFGYPRADDRFVCC